MEYIKIEDSGQRSFGQKKNHTIIFVTGGMGYLRQENEKAVCTMEDLIFIKPGNKVKIEYRKNKYPLELYVLYVGTELLQSLSDENTRLDEAFDIVPFQVKTVHSESESAMLIKNISKKLYSMLKESPKFAHTLYEKSLLTMLLVLALRSSVKEDVQLKLNKKKHVVMDDIFIYKRTPDRRYIIGAPGKRVLCKPLSYCERIQEDDRRNATFIYCKEQTGSVQTLYRAGKKYPRGL